MSDEDLDIERLQASRADFGNVRATVFRGDEVVRVAIRTTPDGRSYIEIAKYGPGAKKLAAVTIRPEELDDVGAGLRDSRNLTLGHPKNETGQSALDQIDKLKRAAK